MGPLHKGSEALIGQSTLRIMLHDQREQVSMHNALIPSGGFYYRGVEYRTFESTESAMTHVSRESPFFGSRIVYNPMMIGEIPFEHVDTVDSEGARRLISERVGLRQVTAGEMDAYAEALIRLHDRIEQQRPTVVIFPLRGGLKPGLQLEVMANFEIQPIWLPYTGGGGGNHEAEIRQAVDDALVLYETESELVLSVVDTAVSGHSVERLALYLKQWVDSERRRPHLRCFMNILFSSTLPSHPYPSRIRSIRQLCSEKVNFMLCLESVPSLLVEDWSEAIGWEVEYAGSGAILKPSVCAGEMLLKTDDQEIAYLRSNRLDLLLDARVARAVSDQIVTDPRREWAFDVWREYTDR